MPLGHTPAPWPYMASSPTVLPARSAGLRMPLPRLTETAEWRKARLGNTGIATNGNGPSLANVRRK